VLSLELGEDGLDRAAGPAPGSPEVDDDGLARFEYIALEALVGDLAHGYSLPGLPAGGVACDADIKAMAALPAWLLNPAQGQIWPRSAASRKVGTFQIASSTIAPLILEPPTSRSANLIGTSTTRKPARSAR
jgi:hypothetical protein